MAAVWRAEAARIVAALARLTGDLGLAEDAAQDALVVALEKWPAEGVPERPGAWLTATARHRAVDLLRRRGRYREKLAELGREPPSAEHAPDPDDYVGDDVLRLVFATCHPVLARPARVALTLRLLGGLTTAEIARAFLVPEATVAKRINRAKRTLAEHRVPIELPPPAEASERLASVLEVVYLIFNEGYSATAGDDWLRPALCAEALRLGRILAEVAPREPEVHGLVALMELHHSRSAARTAPDGTPVLLPEQDRSRWDREAIRRGREALARAGGRLGAYVVQAEIAACHAEGETDWERVAAWYEVLAYLAPSPVVDLNRAVAIGHLDPQRALRLVEALELPGYALLPAVRGELLARLGRDEEARAEFRRAAALTGNAGERKLFERAELRLEIEAYGVSRG